MVGSLFSALAWHSFGLTGVNAFLGFNQLKGMEITQYSLFSTKQDDGANLGGQVLIPNPTVVEIQMVPLPLPNPSNLAEINKIIIGQRPHQYGLRKPNHRQWHNPLPDRPPGKPHVRLPRKSRFAPIPSPGSRQRDAFRRARDRRRNRRRRDPVALRAVDLVVSQSSRQQEDLVSHWLNGSCYKKTFFLFVSEGLYITAFSVSGLFSSLFCKRREWLSACALAQLVTSKKINKEPII